MPKARSLIPRIVASEKLRLFALFGRGGAFPSDSPPLFLSVKRRKPALQTAIFNDGENLRYAIRDLFANPEKEQFDPGAHLFDWCVEVDYDTFRRLMFPKFQPPSGR